MSFSGTIIYRQYRQGTFVGLFCQEFAMAQDLTQIAHFPTHIPDRDDHQPYLIDRSRR